MKEKIPLTVPNTSGHPYRLLAPGPVPVHPEVLQMLSLPPLHHRTPEFEKIFERVLSRLKQVFQTEQPVFCLTASGTGGMESAIINTLSPGDQVLVVEAGKFGERWGKIAESFGLKPDSVCVPWGEAVDPEHIRKGLRINDYRAVLIQACETSTGVFNPIQEIAQVVREFDQTLLIVDGITAVGAANLPMDDWGLDVVIAGSQKAFMLPTGLSFVSLSEKAWQFNETSRIPKFYFDLKKERKANASNQTSFSSAVSLIRGLDSALEIILENGLAAHLKSIHDLSLLTRKVGEALSLENFSNPPSPSLTVFKMPEDVDSASVRSHLEKEYNVTLMGGQDRLKGKILRIGHMGYFTEDDMALGLRHMASALHDLYPLNFGRSLPEKVEALVRERYQ